jgi:hypothetical protein
MTFIWTPYSPCERSKIEDFLKVNCGSFFHEPSFFDYHDKNKFKFLNFVCRKNQKIVGWLPGHKKGHKYISPSGGSYGGPFLSKSVSLEANLEIINSLKICLKKHNINEANITTAPAVYFGDISFLLTALGFKIKHKIACHILHLAAGKWPLLLSKSKRYDYRKASSSGLKATEVGIEHYKLFHKMLRQQSLQFNTLPTHSEDELLLLKKLMPSHLRLFSTMDKDKVIGGVLVFVINPQIAYTFYIVSSASTDQTGAALVALIHCIEKLQKEGFHWLDLGPSTFKNFEVNKGVSRFKQLLGSKLFARDTWACNL